MVGFDPSSIDNWISVTGVIRSGTTFVGKVLSLPIQVDYIHEPFNGGYTLPDHTPFRPQYVRLSDESPDAQAFHEQLSKLFSYQFGLPTTPNPKDPAFRKIIKSILGSRGPFYLRLAKLNPFHTAAIIKDPLSKLATEFMYHHFDVTPVILVRHPASLAASLKRVGWWPDLTDFKKHPRLVEDYFADEPDFLRRSWHSPLLESMAHWRATYKFLLAQANSYSDWHVVTHEELSDQPIRTFRTLYEALDLPWSSSVARSIQQLTQGSGAGEAQEGKVMDLDRESSKIFELRRDSLSVEERRAIFDVVHDVALKIYSRESFNID